MRFLLRRRSTARQSMVQPRCFPLRFLKPAVAPQREDDLRTKENSTKFQSRDAVQVTIFPEWRAESP